MVLSIFQTVVQLVPSTFQVVQIPDCRGRDIFFEGIRSIWDGIAVRISCTFNHVFITQNLSNVRLKESGSDNRRYEPSVCVCVCKMFFFRSGYVDQYSTIYKGMVYGMKNLLVYVCT